MSFVVLAIAAIPAGGVYAAGVVSTSKALLAGAAAVAIALGVLTGNPAYVGVDVIAVLIALYCGNIAINKNRKIKAAETEAAQATRSTTGFPPNSETKEEARRRRAKALENFKERSAAMRATPEAKAALAERSEKKRQEILEMQRAQARKD